MTCAFKKYCLPNIYIFIVSIYYHQFLLFFIQQLSSITYHLLSIYDMAMYLKLIVILYYDVIISPHVLGSYLYTNMQWFKYQLYYITAPLSLPVLYSEIKTSTFSVIIVLIAESPCETPIQIQPVQIFILAVFLTYNLHENRTDFQKPQVSFSAVYIQIFICIPNHNNYLLNKCVDAVPV